RTHPGHDLADVHAFEAVVEPRPPRHAVDVAADLRAGQLQELFPGPGQLLLHEAEAAERPALRIEAWREPVGEDGPLGGQGLTGRSASNELLGSRGHLISSEQRCYPTKR